MKIKIKSYHAKRADDDEEKKQKGQRFHFSNSLLEVGYDLFTGFGSQFMGGKALAFPQAASNKYFSKSTTHGTF